MCGVALLAACSPSAEDIREDCLKNKDNQIFYGEQTSLYCDCVYEKLKVVENEKPLTDSIIDSIKNECDAEYTSLDVNF